VSLVTIARSAFHSQGSRAGCSAAEPDPNGIFVKILFCKYQ
jgi:hypothetical protein